MSVRFGVVIAAHCRWAALERPRPVRCIEVERWHNRNIYFVVVDIHPSVQQISATTMLRKNALSTRAQICKNKTPVLNIPSTSFKIRPEHPCVYEAMHASSSSGKPILGSEVMLLGATGVLGGPLSSIVRHRPNAVGRQKAGCAAHCAH